MNRFTLTIAALLAATATYAEVYQWKDANGKTHYSDQPPAGTVVTQTQKTESAAPASTPSAAAPKTTADKDLEFRMRQKESQDKAEKAKKEQDAANSLKDNCDSARKYLQTLESGERISQLNDKGEREYMTDARRQEETSKARQTIQANCK